MNFSGPYAFIAKPERFLNNSIKRSVAHSKANFIGYLLNKVFTLGQSGMANGGT